MITNQITIYLSIICMLLLMRSWYIHFVVKDGLARIMLLWGCGLLFFFLLVRVMNIHLFDIGCISNELSRQISYFNVWLIYALVIGQTILQLGGRERKEAKDLQADKKELKKRRNK